MSWKAFLIQQLSFVVGAFIGIWAVCKWYVPWAVKRSYEKK